MLQYLLQKTLFEGICGNFCILLSDSKAYIEQFLKRINAPFLIENNIYITWNKKKIPILHSKFIKLIKIYDLLIKRLNYFPISFRVFLKIPLIIYIT